MFLKDRLQRRNIKHAADHSEVQPEESEDTESVQSPERWRENGRGRERRGVAVSYRICEGGRGREGCEMVAEA